MPSSGASEDGVFGKAKNIITRAKNDAATIAHNFCLSVWSLSALIIIFLVYKLIYF